MHTGIIYIDRETFEEKAKTVGGAHWDSFESRWVYFHKTIEILSRMPIHGPSDILEVGTNGVPVVVNADTMDYAKGWDYAGKAPTYLQDMRIIPWPIADKRYHVFIALRVWQHLGDKQEACFREAKRIARHLILVVPEKYRKGYGVSPDTVTKWNDGVPPVVEDVGRMGKLYFI